MKKKKVITSALPYANAFLHLGHIASTYLPADIFARYMKLAYGKENVSFVCATDEHGTPIEINAKKYHLPPEEYIKIFRDEHKKDLANVKIEFDSFYGTHTPENQELVNLFFKKAKEKGLLYEQEIEALYCPHCKMFLPDRYVVGTCPYCHAPNQYGDVCEVCGKTYSAKELINPRCAICGSTPILKKTKHVFFKLSSLQKEIENYLKNNDKLQEDARNYALSWIKKGLKDLDITRDAPYFGFPIPEHKDKYFYVWIDAPLGYIASFMHAGNSLDNWNSSTITHFIGKDIIYFHYIYWIAILITLDFQLPKNIPTRGYLTLNKQKMSKSRGNFIYLRDLYKYFSPCFIRYYFGRSIPDHIADGDFSWDEFLDKSNKELIGIIVNLLYRVSSFIYNNFPHGLALPNALSQESKDLLTKVGKKIEDARIKEALEDVLAYANKLNAKFNELEPWNKIKFNKEETFKEMKSLLLEVIALAMALEPYLPSLVHKFYSFFDFKRKSWMEFQEVSKIYKVEHLLNKLDVKEVELIKGDNVFSKLDLKIGEIREVAPHEDADKLYVIKLWDGDRERQLVAGLKNYYTPEELLNKKVVFVSNLKPAKLRGKVSEGMLLAASNGDRVGILYVEDNKILAGSDVVIPGIIKKPNDQISIEEVRKVKLKTKNNGVVWQDWDREGSEIIARSACHEEKVKVHRYEEIGDGKDIY